MTDADCGELTMWWQHGAMAHMTERVTSSKYDIPISVGTLRSSRKAKHATNTGMPARITWRHVEKDESMKWTSQQDVV